LCCRYVLEVWTYEEAERRSRTEHIPNASVTCYDLEGGGLILRAAGTVYWSEREVSTGTAE
jgi:hypothetical protein